MPFDPTDKAKLLYDAVSKDYDLGTYDEFQTKLKDPTKRKAFFDGIGHEYDLGDYNTFNQKLGYDSQEVKQQSQPQQSVTGIPMADIGQVQSAISKKNQELSNQPIQEEGQAIYSQMAKRDNAIHNTIERNNQLQNKPVDKTSPEYQQQFDNLLSQEKNHDVKVVDAKDGKPFVVPTSGFWENAGKSFVQSLKAPVEAIKQIGMDNKELSDYFENKKKNEPYLPESVPSPIGGLGQTLGGLPKTVGELAIPVVGEALAATETELSSTGQQTEALYNRRLQELKDAKGDQNYEPTPQEKEQIAGKARLDAPLAAAPDAAMILVLNKMGGDAPALNKSAETFSQSLSKYGEGVGKLAALGGTSEGVRSGIMALQGYHVTPQEALDKSVEGATTWGLMDAMFKVAPLVSKLPKAAQAAWKDYMTQVPKPVFEEKVSQMGDEGQQIKEDVSKFDEAKNIVHPKDEEPITANETAANNQEEIPQHASKKLFITKDDTQQLYDLGYSKDEVNKFTPEQAQEILNNGTAKIPNTTTEEKPKEEPQAEVIQPKGVEGNQPSNEPQPSVEAGKKQEDVGENIQGDNKVELKDVVGDAKKFVSEKLPSFKVANEGKYPKDEMIKAKTKVLEQNGFSRVAYREYKLAHRDFAKDKPDYEQLFVRNSDGKIFLLTNNKNELIEWAKRHDLENAEKVNVKEFYKPKSNSEQGAQESDTTEKPQGTESQAPKKEQQKPEKQKDNSVVGDAKVSKALNVNNDVAKKISEIATKSKDFNNFKEQVKDILTANAKKTSNKEQVAAADTNESGGKVGKGDKEEKIKTFKKRAKPTIKSPLYKNALNIEDESPRAQTLKYFINGGKIHTDALKELFGNKGGKNVNAELNAKLQLRSSAPKTPKTIDALAHKLWDNSPEEVQSKYDSQDFRNAIEDVLQSHNSRTSMAEEMVNTMSVDEKAMSDWYDKTYSVAEKHGIEEEDLNHAIDILEGLSDEEIQKIADEQPNAYGSHEYIKKVMELHGVEDGITVKPFKKGDGGTKGIFEDNNGNLYKSVVPQELTRTDKGIERKPIPNAETDEYSLLSELQDNPHVPKIGNIVETSEGKAFQIEKLNEVDKFTRQEYGQIQDILNDLNDKGYHVGDKVTVMKRPQTGELVVIDFSHGYKGDRMSRDAEDYMQDIKSKLSKSDAIDLDQENKAESDRKMANALLKDESTTQYYLTQRPPSIGTHPIEGLVDEPKETEFRGRKAWLLTYDRKLSKDEIYNSELTPKITDKEFLGQKVNGVFGKKPFYVTDIDYKNGKVKLASELDGKEIDLEKSFKEFQKNLDDGKYKIEANKQPTQNKQGNIEQFKLKYEDAKNNYNKALSELRKAEEKISQKQATQTGMFGEAAQKEMFGVGRDEAKDILTPLKTKVKEAKAALDEADKNWENAVSRSQPTLDIPDTDRKKFSDQIRDISKKIKGSDPNALYSDITALPRYVIGKALDLVADAIDAGETIADAIAKGAKHLMDKAKESKIKLSESKANEIVSNELFETEYFNNKLKDLYSDLTEKNPTLPKEETPPAEPPKEPPVAENPKEPIGIRHEDTKVIREQHGLGEYEKIPETIKEWDEEAGKRIDNGEMPALLKKMDEGNTVISAVEQRMMGKYIATLNDEVTNNPTPDSLAKLRHAVELSDKIGGSEWGRSGRARQDVFLPEDSLGKFLIDKESAQEAKLTDKQLEEQTKEYNELKKAHDDYKAAYEKEQEESARLRAENEFLKSKKNAKKNTNRDYSTEKKQVLQDARDALKKLRQSGNLQSAIPFAQQAKELITIAPHVGKYAKILIDEGIEKFEHLVDRLHDEFKEFELSKKDIINILDGQYNEKKELTRNEKAELLRNLKKEASLLNQIEKERKEVEKEKSQTKKAQKTERIQDLENKLKELQKKNKEKEGITEKTDEEFNAARAKSLIKSIEKVSDDLKSGKYLEEKPEPKEHKLTAKTQALQDRLIELQKKREIEIYKDQLSKRTKWQKAMDIWYQALGLKRLVQTAIDVSLIGRQLATVTFNPRRWEALPRILSSTFKSFGSQKQFDRINYAIHHSAFSKEMMDDGIHFIEFESPNVEKRSDFFPNKSFLYEVKYLREPFLASNRAADASANVARFELYMQGKRRLERMGITRENSPEEYKGMAKAINNITGSGNMLSWIENNHGAKKFLGNTLYGAKFMASRFNLLNPVYYAKLPKAVRIEALKDIISFTTTLTAISLAAKAAGAKVSVDPNDSDFLKIRVGNNVYDLSGGLIGYVKIFARMTEAAYTRGKYMTGNATDKEVQSSVGRAEYSLNTFVQSKLAPNTGYAVSAFTGKNAIGKDFNPTDVLKIYPMYVDDLIQAYNDSGITSLATVLVPDVFGIGVSTYPEKTPTLFSETAQKDPTFKFFMDKSGGHMPNVELKNQTYIDATTKHTHSISEAPKEKQDQYTKVHEAELLNGLKAIKSRNYVYTNGVTDVKGNKQISITYKKGKNLKRIPLGKLNEAEYQKIESLVQKSASTKAKKSVFKDYSDDQNNEEEK